MTPDPLLMSIVAIILGLIVCGGGGLLAGMAARYSKLFHAPEANRVVVITAILTLGFAVSLAYTIHIAWAGALIATAGFMTFCGYKEWPYFGGRSKNSFHSTKIHPN